MKRLIERVLHEEMYILYDGRNDLELPGSVENESLLASVA